MSVISNILFVGITICSQLPHWSKSVITSKEIASATCLFAYFHGALFLLRRQFNNNMQLYNDTASSTTIKLKLEC